MCSLGLAFSRGEAAAADRHLRRAVAILDAAGFREPAILRIHADAIEAAIATGDLKRAEELPLRFEQHAKDSEIDWNRATSRRCRALLQAAQGDLAAAAETIEQALAEHERLPMPVELGRTLLVQGQIERRLKHKRAAKEALKQASALFEQLGTRLWAEKARAELERVAPRPSEPGQLSATEARVAGLAAAGSTNRDVAAALFMSPKTVEVNLARIYQKLGIRSRAELGARLAQLEQPSATK
jgi:ATP/maltotriose-dependent transcriptional regulator MalT